MNQQVRVLVFAAATFAQFCLCADTRAVIGYGSGDDLQQALCVAQGDAVLNAGAKTTVAIESSKDQLIGDKGVASNVLFLAEYKILEKGESFDGVYARIQATVCDVSDRKFDNGRYLTGEGKGVSERSARVAAVGNAIMSMGARVRAVGIYEKDELVRDETEFTGWAYVSDVEELEKLSKGGDCFSKVRIKVFANKGVSGASTDVEKKSFGIGGNVLEAMADARTRAILDFDAPYVAQTTYETGVLKSKMVKRHWRGFCYGAELEDRRQTGDSWRVDISQRFNDNVKSEVADGISNGVGFGIGKNRDDAVERARWDAVLNSGCVAEIDTTYADGKEPEERVRLVGAGYMGKADVEFMQSGNAQIAEIKGLVSRSANANSQCELNESLGRGQADTGYKAYLLARHRALASSGARYDVERIYCNNAIISNVVKMAAERRCCGFVLEGGITHAGSAEVALKMKQLASGDAVGGTTKGVAIASSAHVAEELARSDAVLNFCSDIMVESRHEQTRMVESAQTMKGGAYLVGASAKVVALPDATYFATVEADAARRGSDVEKLLGRNVEFEGRRSDSMEGAICANRRGFLIRSGATVDAAMEYKNLGLVSALATYRAEGVMSSCQVNVSGSDGVGYVAKVAGRTFRGGQSAVHENSKTVGCGCGKSFDEARESAIEDVLINARSEFSAEEKYEQGKLVKGQSTCSADGYIFDTELLSAENVDGRSVVKVKCEISPTRGNALDVAKKKIKVKGWGVSEAAARADAERNAVDAVFGRYASATIKEIDGIVVSRNGRDEAFEGGYVDESKVEQTIQKFGLYEVAVSAVVCQRGKEESGWSWVTIVVIIVVLIGVIGVAKQKGGIGLAVVAWLICSIALFATGHWGVGLMVAILGLGAIKN